MSAITVLGACSDDATDDARAADAAVLVDHFESSWLPADAELFEQLTSADACSTDCPPVGISYTYLCACADLDAAMADVQDRLESSGFETVLAYSPDAGFLEAKVADDSLVSGYVWVRAYAIADAVEYQPLNTALAARAAGRSAINISLLSADPSAS